jgi:hypothetical protein
MTKEFIQLFKYEGYERDEHRMEMSVNPLNAQLNPICHLLTLLEAHHILNVSRIRVKGINNDKSKLITLPEFCRIAVISLALVCYI